MKRFGFVKSRRWFWSSCKPSLNPEQCKHRRTRGPGDQGTRGPVFVSSRWVVRGDFSRPWHHVSRRQESLRAFANPSKAVTRHWLPFHEPNYVVRAVRLIHMASSQSLSSGRLVSLVWQTFRALPHEHHLS